MKKTSSKHLFPRFSPLSLAIGTLLSATATLGFAQTQDVVTNDDSDMEYIEITADLSQRDLSDLPTSAIILNQESIKQRQARHLQDVLNMVPNVNFSAGASRGKFVQIRGIGERSQFAEPINPSIGIMLDDIDISGLGGLATVHDLRQVEVLSGPQSVATGLNSLGGIVKLVSNTPDPSAYANLTASVAEYGERQLAGIYNNALSNSLSGRFSVQKTQSDGFVENAFLGRDDTDGTDELSASARFNMRLSPRSQLDFNVYHFDIKNGYDAFSLDNDNISQADQPGFDNIDAQALSLKYSHNLDAHKLQLTLSGLNADTDYAYDEDWTFVGFHPNAYSSFDSYSREIERRAVDLKFASAQDSNNQNTSSYLIGINLSQHEEDLIRIYTFDDDYNSLYKPTNNSIYGQYETTIFDQVGITVAARAEQFSADFFDSEGSLTQIDDNLFAASLALDYKIAQSLLYASISRGYKAGGFNIDRRLPPNTRGFKPEFNYNYEFGIKGSAFDGDANLNLSFFYMEREDAQVSDFVVFTNLLEDGTPVPSFIDAIGNADSGVNKGIELASTWDLTKSWYVVANFGYLDATFGNYTKTDGSLVPKQTQAQAPKYTAYLSSNWRLGQDLNWFVDIDIKDEHRFSDGHNELAPFTAVVNTELSWDLYPVQLKFWVKNVFDREIFTRGFGGFSNDPREDYAIPEPYYQFGHPRQVGLTLSYTFE